MSGSGTETILTDKSRSVPGCFCRQQGLFLGQILEEVEKGNAGEWKETVLLMLRAVLAEVDMQNHGAKASGSGSYPAAQLPCLIT